MKPVDDCPVSIAPMTDEVRRDLKDERDSEAYQAMYAEVEDEMLVQSFGWGYGSPKPDGRKVHDEAMKRLKENAA